MILQDFRWFDLDHEPDISWIKKMSKRDHIDDVAFIDQALQQTKFKMDEKGASAESAAAMSCGYECCCVNMNKKPDFVIDKPFCAWINRKGMSMPLFAGYIAIADWKRPSKN